MPWKWPIRRKLLLGLALLVLVVAILSSTGMVATNAYRNLAKSLSWRVCELPLAAELSRRVSDLRITLGELRGLRVSTFPDARQELVPLRVQIARGQFGSQLNEVSQTLSRYLEQLSSEAKADPLMSDHRREHETAHKIKTQLDRIREAAAADDWMLDSVKIGWFDVELEQLQTLSSELPSHLYAKMAGFSQEVRGQYELLFFCEWATAISGVLIFFLFMRLSYRWIFRPLRILIAGSRRVAAGEFDFRIQLDTHDEMSELSKAMNDMTLRFQEIRDDLDRQVQIRTKQVVRNEQLASVGFLAAGVAHEINNPLASIAMCAESLEGRFREMIDESNPEHTVVANYLQMIQSEAFRCKGITEKLLDFSRVGPGRREATDLGELVRGVIEMLGHLGKYQRKHVEFVGNDIIVAEVNPQELKQVVLNLLTNAMDSLDDGGCVRVRLESHDGRAVLTVTDNGCGMTPDVQEHIFEPFFTRRRDGQGVGLGLSITYRIIADHGGDIEATSDGAGRGSTFRVRLPLAGQQIIEKESHDQRQAA